MVNLTDNEKSFIDDLKGILDFYNVKIEQSEIDDRLFFYGDGINLDIDESLNG